MDPSGRNRRQFLKDAAKGTALAGLTLGAVRSASAEVASYAGAPDDGQNSGYFDPTLNPEPQFLTERGEYGTPLQDIVGIITPNQLHFGGGGHRSALQNIDARKHRFLIYGMVDRPLEFTMDDLKRLPRVSRIAYIACCGNGGVLHAEQRQNPGKTVQQTHGETGCAEWTGVLVSTVLKMAGAQKGGNWLVAESVDGKKHTMSFPLSVAMAGDAILAYAMNGEPMPPKLGYPLRVLLPGAEGSRNVKWLGKIKVMDQPPFSHYESVSYTNVMPYDGKARDFQMEMEVNGVITFPSGGQQLPGPGTYEIRGLAWTGGGSIHRVEVSVDGGKTWRDAQIQLPIHRKAHVAFYMPWKWDGEEAVLMSRSTDDNGDIQPMLAQFSKIWHVTPDFWQHSSVTVQHFNACQPWRIDRQGKVTNGMFHPSNNV